MLNTFQGDRLALNRIGEFGFKAPPFLRTYILAADFDSDGHPTRPAPVLEFAPDTEVSQIFTPTVGTLVG